MLYSSDGCSLSGDLLRVHTAVKTGTALGATSITEVTLLEVCFWKEHLCRQNFLAKRAGTFQISCFAVPHYYLRRCHPAAPTEAGATYTRIGEYGSIGGDETQKRDGLGAVTADK